MPGTVALLSDARATRGPASETPKPRRFGSVRRMKSGRWQARYKCPTCDKMHPAHTTFDTPGMAEQHLAGVRMDMMRDRYVCLVHRQRQAAAAQRQEAAERAAEVSFAKYASLWLVRRSERLKPRTVMLYRRQLECDLLPTLGDVPLTALDVHAVDQWWEALTAQHPQRKTANSHVYGLLKTIMNSAVRDRKQPRVTANPCQVDPEELARPKRKQNDPATVAQLQAIADAMPERLALAVWLAAYSGLRFGELAELRRRDVDTTGGEPMLDVKRAVVHREGRTIVGEPKSDAGVRVVYLPGFLRDRLLAHLEQHAQPGPKGCCSQAPAPHAARAGAVTRAARVATCSTAHCTARTTRRATRPGGETCGGTTCGTPGSRRRRATAPRWRNCRLAPAIRPR